MTEVASARPTFMHLNIMTLVGSVSIGGAGLRGSARRDQSSSLPTAPFDLAQGPIRRHA
jgi:hypothetical protein